MIPSKIFDYIFWKIRQYFDEIQGKFHFLMNNHVIPRGGPLKFIRPDNLDTFQRNVLLLRIFVIKDDSGL